MLSKASAMRSKGPVPELCSLEQNMRCPVEERQYVPFLLHTPSIYTDDFHL